MGIIDAEHPSAAWLVKREWIADAVRSIDVRRNALRHDLDPDAASDFRQKAIEIQKTLERVIAARHTFNISDTDNQAARARRRSYRAARELFTAGRSSARKTAATSCAGDSYVSASCAPPTGWLSRRLSLRCSCFSESWLAALDDFRNWLIREAA
jgi:hypothetical protein